MKNIFLILLLCSSIFYAVPSGAQISIWNEIASNTDKKLNVIDFPSPRVGYIAGNDSVLLKSTDHGKTWQALSTTGINFPAFSSNFSHIEFIDEEQGYVILETGAVYHTENGGANWTEVSASLFCFPKTAYFFDEDNGIFGGNNCFAGETVQRLSNGAWEFSKMLNSFNSTLSINSIDFLDNSYGLAVGNSPYIFKTIDGGASWDTINSTLDTIALTDVVIVDDTLAYASYAENTFPNLLISTDAGQSWEQDFGIATFFYPNFYTVEKTNSGGIYVGGHTYFNNGGLIMAKEDEFWITHTVDRAIFDMATYGDTTVFAVGDSGYIITNANPVLLGTTVHSPENRPEIYPNPTNGLLNINGMGPTDYSVYLTDMQGRTVMETTIFDQQPLDLSSLAAGAYLLRIRQGDRMITEKIFKTGNL